MSTHVYDPKHTEAKGRRRRNDQESEKKAQENLQKASCRSRGTDLYKVDAHRSRKSVQTSINL